MTTLNSYDNKNEWHDDVADYKSIKCKSPGMDAMRRPLGSTRGCCCLWRFVGGMDVNGWVTTFSWSCWTVLERLFQVSRSDKCMFLGKLGHRKDLGCVQLFLHNQVADQVGNGRLSCWALCIAIEGGGGEVSVIITWNLMVCNGLLQLSSHPMVSLECNYLSLLCPVDPRFHGWV